MPNNDSKKARFLAVLKKYFRKDEIWLIPNVLCYVRVFLIILSCASISFRWTSPETPMPTSTSAAQ